MFVFVFLLTRQIGPRAGESKEKYEEKQLWRHVTISLWGMLFKVTVAFSSCQHKITGSDEQCRMQFSSAEVADIKNAPYGAFQTTERICHST